MKKIFVLMLALLTVGLLGGCGGSDKELRLGTGGIGGMYFDYGNHLVEQLKKFSADHAFTVKATAGSAANIRLIRDGFLDFAIVQSDILARGVDNRGMFNTEGCTIVAALYDEPCQIIVAAQSNIKTVADLAGKRVSIGEEESGVLKNATEILLAHGLTVGMIKPVHLSFADAAAALERNEIDAFFCTAGAPTKAIADLAEKKSIGMLAVSPDVINNMSKVYGGYARCTIPAGTYRGLDADVETIGTKAVLIAAAAVDPKAVESVAQTVFDNGLDVNYAVAGINGAFHQGVVDFYDARGVKVNVYNGDAGNTVIAGQD